MIREMISESPTGLSRVNYIRFHLIITIALNFCIFTVQILEIVTNYILKQKNSTFSLFQRCLSILII